MTAGTGSIRNSSSMRTAIIDRRLEQFRPGDRLRIASAKKQSDGIGDFAWCRVAVPQQPTAASGKFKFYLGVIEPV
jgi:hypothetical protein